MTGIIFNYNTCSWIHAGIFSPQDLDSAAALGKEQLCRTLGHVLFSASPVSGTQGAKDSSLCEAKTPVSETQGAKDSSLWKATSCRRLGPSPGGCLWCGGTPWWRPQRSPRLIGQTRQPGRAFEAHAPPDCPHVLCRQRLSGAYFGGNYFRRPHWNLDWFPNLAIWAFVPRKRVSWQSYGVVEQKEGF